MTPSPFRLMGEQLHERLEQYETYPELPSVVMLREALAVLTLADQQIEERDEEIEDLRGIIRGLQDVAEGRVRSLDDIRKSLT